MLHADEGASRSLSLGLPGIEPDDDAAVERYGLVSLHMFSLVDERSYSSRHSNLGNLGGKARRTTVSTSTSLSLAIIQSSMKVFLTLIVELSDLGTSLLATV